MFAAVAVFNILNFLFQLFMIRNLNAVDYGILNSLLSILVIVSIPSGTLQTVVTKYISIFNVINHHDNIKILILSFLKKTLIFGMILFLLFVLCKREISSFIQVTSPLLIVILGLTTFLSVNLPIAQGGLQGLQRFGYLGLVMITNGGLKLLFGIVFVYIGYGVTGAMSSVALSILITLFLAFIILASVLPKSIIAKTDIKTVKPDNTETDINFSEVHRYFYPVVLVYFCFMILTNVDVVLVKHFYNPLDAGYYSISQMVGKIILFLPVAVTLVMFPKTSELHAQNKDTLHVLKKSTVYVGALSGTAAIVCLFFPGVIIRLLSGQANPECIPMARIFSVTMFFYSLVYVLLFYNLSIHRLSFIYFLVLLTGLQLLAIILFHQTLIQIIYIMCGNAILLFLINLYFAFKRKEFNVTPRLGSNS